VNVCGQRRQNQGQFRFFFVLPLLYGRIAAKGSGAETEAGVSTEFDLRWHRSARLPLLYTTLDRSYTVLCRSIERHVELGLPPEDALHRPHARSPDAHAILDRGNQYQPSAAAACCSAIVPIADTISSHRLINYFAQISGKTTNTYHWAKCV